jgi:signal transduction histidine kinase
VQDENQIDIIGLKARVSTLEQLLDVYGRSVIEQSDKLYAEQERMRFQKILLECQGEASLDGILSVGVDGDILFANQRLSEMWGTPAPTVGTRSYGQFLQVLAQRTNDPAGFIERASVAQSGEASREEISLRDGRTFDQYTAPIRSADGNEFGRVSYFRDISVFKEMDRLKDDFISAVSHELRTPLTAIVGSLGLLSSGVMGELSGEAAKMVETARRNCDRLVRLVGDVLDIEKIEAGRMDFHIEVRELAPLLDQSIEMIRPYGVQFGASFQIESSSPAILVQVDPDRLLQVLENLLSNAAKFSPPEGTVRVALTRRGRFARVSVRDRGPGIAPEFRSRLFEKFTQGGAPKGLPHVDGTGLGLNISRAIVERLGGTIGFQCDPATGTTFYFELPEWRGERDAQSMP